METIAPELAEALLNARKRVEQEPLPEHGTREYYQALAYRANAAKKAKQERAAARQRLRDAGIAVTDADIPEDPDDFHELRPRAMQEVAKQLKHKDPKVRRAMTETVLQFTDGRYAEKDDDGVREIVYLTPALIEELDEAVARVEATPDEPKAPFVPVEA